MNLPIRLLSNRLDALEKRIRAGRATNFTKYRLDPCGYAKDVLGVTWWGKQKEIAESLCRPPFKTLVKASHSVGKSMVAGGLVNWWYDTRVPSLCITTAPRFAQVKDVLWKEVRMQRRGRPGFVGPKVPRLESAPDHYAVGTTADSAEALQGQHGPAVLFILDEAVGIDPFIWQAADSMMMGVEYALLAICNPTDQASEFYFREQLGTYTVIDIPCIEHPNIAEELAGRAPVYPSAVRLAWFEEHLKLWSDRIDSKDAKPTDLEWPPGSGVWYRPGPLAQARLLARWPDVGCGVWSDSLWSVTERPQELPDHSVLPEIGCDVARFGDDYTEIHVKVGQCSLSHEAHNGWDTAQTAGRLKQLAKEWSEWANARKPGGSEQTKPQQIRCKIDDDGVGGGVTDQADGYNFQPVSSAERAFEDDYPNRRSEMWFAVAEKAKRGGLDLSRLSSDSRRELKRQAISPTYKLDGAGRRVVEPKDITKKKLGRSPDGMDALNIAHAATPDMSPVMVSGRATGR